MYHATSKRQRRLTTNKRRLLYILATVLFLGAAPVIIMYAQGYRVRLSTRQVYRTVSLAVQSSPRDAAVELDHELRGKAPITITGLFPGSYDLTITKAEYQPWSAKLDFGSRSLTIAPHLAPQSASQARLELTDIIGRLSDRRGGVLLLQRRDGGVARLLRYIVPDRQLSELLVLNNWDQTTARLELSDDGSRLAIIGPTRLIAVDLRVPSALNIQTVRYSDGAAVRMSGSHEALYLNESGTIWRLTLASGEARVIVGSGVRDFVIVENLLAIISDLEDFSLRLLDAKSGISTGTNFSEISDHARFVSAHGRTVVIRDGHNSLLFDTSRREIVRLEIEDITEVVYASDGATAILRSMTDVWELSVNDRQGTLVRRLSDLSGASRLPVTSLVFILTSRSLEAVDPLYPSAQAGTYEISQTFTSLTVVTDDTLMLSSDTGVEFLSFLD